MGDLRYLHQTLRPLVSVATGLIYRWVAGRLLSPDAAGRRRLPWRRLAIIAAVVITLVIEAVMLYWLAELVDLCISLMEVWTELAAKHLEITLDRSS